MYYIKVQRGGSSGYMTSDPPIPVTWKVIHMSEMY